MKKIYFVITPFLPPYVPFWSLWKHQKIFGFLTFSGGSKGTLEKKRVNNILHIWYDKNLRHSPETYFSSVFYIINSLSFINCLGVSFFLINVPLHVLIQKLFDAKMILCNFYAEHKLVVKTQQIVVKKFKSSLYCLLKWPFPATPSCL